MYFDFDYVIVSDLTGFESTRVDRSFKHLYVKIPRTSQKICFKLNRNIHVPPLKKGDRIRIYLSIYTRGKSSFPQFKVTAIRHFS